MADLHNVISKLKERIRFLTSTCPEHRIEKDAGFSQAEAYYWKNLAISIGEKYRKLAEKYNVDAN